MSKKKNKIKIISIVFAVLIILIGIGFVVNNYILQEATPGTCRGTATVLGISSQDIQINDQNPDKPTLRILMTTNNNGECAQLGFNSNSLQVIETKLTSRGYVLTEEAKSRLQNFKFNAVLVKQEKIYNIVDDPFSPIYNVQKIQVDGFTGEGLIKAVAFSINTCRDLSQQGKIPGKTLTSSQSFHFSISNPSDNYCFQKVQYGTIGRIGEGSIFSSIDFYLNDQKIKTLTSSKLSEVEDNGKLGIDKPGQFHITYQGGLQPQLPRTIELNNYAPLIVNNQYYLISSLNRQNIIDLGNKLDQCVAKVPSVHGYKNPGTDEIVACTNKYNSDFASTILPKSSNIKLDFPSVENVEVESSSQGQIGRLKLDITHTPQTYPVFTIDTNADYIKIIRLAGEPEITSCPSELDLKSLQSKNIKYTVRNKGNFDGSFTPELKCNGISQSISPGTQLVRSKDSVDFIGQLLIGVEKDTSVECLFTIRDTVSGISKSCTTTVDVRARKCDENQLICDINNPNILKICKNGIYEELQACQNGCINGPNGPQCEGKTDTCKNNAINYPDCNKCLSGFKFDSDKNKCVKDENVCKNIVSLSGITVLPDFGSRPRTSVTEKVTGFFLGEDTISCTSIFGYVKWAVSMIVLLVSLILIMLILKDLFDKGNLFGSKGINLLIAFILALVLSILLFILTAKIFWLAIIIFILIIIIKIVVKSLIPLKL